MDKTWICSCGHYEWHENTGEDLEDFGPSAWYHNWPCDGGDYNNNIFCFKCGDQLLPDGRVIQRETIPNKLMAMLKEVQATCPEAGLQEFALRVFNWIEELREQAGLTERELLKITDDYSCCGDYESYFLDTPHNVSLNVIFSLLNAAKQEAKSGD